MQFLDDDMDELFRNAASDYPLNTGGGDWDAVRKRLQQADDDQSGTATGGYKGRWWSKPGMFVLIIGLLLIIAVKGLYNGAPDPSGTPAPGQHGHAGGQGVTTAGTKPVQATVQMPVTEQEEDKEVTNGSQFAKGNRLVAGTSDQEYTHEHVVKTDPVQVTVRSERDAEEKTTIRNSEQDVPNSSYPAAKQGITAVTGTPGLSIASIYGRPYNDQAHSVGILHAGNSISMPSQSSQDAAIAAKPAPSYLKKGFYYGLHVSPDITTVKGQRASDVGYSVGLIAGYRLGRRLAIETGVAYERKYYYSDGKYFNPKTSPWPGSMKILDVDGWCNMFEIPLNVRYTFATGKKSSWYVNGGISSYIMNRQGYNYSYEYYGNPGERYWEYEKTTKDWFSNAHVGVGYERPAGVLGTLRIEPFMMIPIKGIGAGRLPIRSVGMNVGLTRSLRLK